MEAWQWAPEPGIKGTRSICNNTRHKKKQLFEVSEVTDTWLLS